jgi:hypothetical protein
MSEDDDRQTIPITHPLARPSSQAQSNQSRTRHLGPRCERASKCHLFLLFHPAQAAKSFKPLPLRLLAAQPHPNSVNFCVVNLTNDALRCLQSQFPYQMRNPESSAFSKTPRCKAARLG